ncbi:hypothetical protein AJ80_05538 [Polytolypa hystricis UAMH7299]|uniref:Uncharacterized protein n=1 Tax=Polytolypa hystricis (strain UAMH7299) TaxID=1447883 RepID=A0A2B7Y3A1_POLH7|nr:hypothetical protein AJ80_05538 [Polytolypa hystricis UAMH7299]
MDAELWGMVESQNPAHGFSASDYVVYSQQEVSWSWRRRKASSSALVNAIRALQDVTGTDFDARHLWHTATGPSPLQLAIWDIENAPNSLNGHLTRWIDIYFMSTLILKRRRY